LYLPKEDGFPYSNQTNGVLGKYDAGNKPLNYDPNRDKETPLE